MSVTFVHAADLHLGSPLRAVEDASPSFAERLNRATYEAFQRVIDIAVEHEVDFVVVAGDLYDREARSVAANQFLVDQFERLADAEIPCYVVHGNHDPLGDGAEKLDLPANVSVFGTEEVESAYYPDGDGPEARILGQSYGSRHESGSLYYHYTPDDQSVPNIGVLHTGLDPDGRRYAPCSLDDLGTKAIDYWALGHIHRTELFDGAPAAYPGIPQGRHAGELGVGGCLLVTVERDAEPDVEFVPTSPIVWHEHEIDIGDVAADQTLRNISDAETYIDDRALDLRNTELSDLVTFEGIPIADVDWDPDGFVCRWTFTGRGDLHDVLDSEATSVLAERLRNRLGDGQPFVWTEAVRDRTGVPIPDIETLADDDEVIGELHALVSDLRDDPAIRDDLRTKTGDVWEWVDDPDREDMPPDRQALDDERLDDLIDRALQTAVDCLAVQRNHVD